MLKWQDIYMSIPEISIYQLNKNDRHIGEINMTITKPQPGQGPNAFSGQLAAYNHDSTYTEREIVAVDTREITTPNPNPATDHFYYNLATGALPMGRIISANGTVQFVRVGKGNNPQQYQNKRVP